MKKNTESILLAVVTIILFMMVAVAGTAKYVLDSGATVEHVTGTITILNMEGNAGSVRLDDGGKFVGLITFSDGSAPERDDEIVGTIYDERVLVIENEVTS